MLKMIVIVMYGILYFWFKYALDRSTMHPKFNPTGIRSRDLQIMKYILCH